MPRVVVTGGAGFIGSHIVEGYLEAGWHVTVIDDLSTGLRENVDPRADFVGGDLRDAEILRMLSQLEPEVINHHAAQVDVRKSVADIRYDAELNILVSLDLLKLSQQIGVRKFIFASSGGAAYGEPVETPQSESHPEHPLSPYGCAKLAVDKYIGYFREIHGLHAASLRYGNVYGPRQRPEGEAGVVAIFAGRMLRGEPVTINGSGEQTRDYIFVEDVVRANLAISTSDLEGVFNVGTGIETSVNELYASLAGLIDTAAPVGHGPAKQGEQQRSVLDGSKLRAAAQLPSPVGLEEGLARTLESFKAEA
jgi:UDP-glucose 4-epimerase